jgi:transposase-like protein
MPTRKIVDETDAQACLEAAERSGLPRTEWARAHGVDARSLNAWRMNLERRGHRSPPASPLRLVELVSGEAPVDSANSGIRLVIGDLVVEVDRGFDPGTLGRVLNLVAPC